MSRRYSYGGYTSRRIDRKFLDRLARPLPTEPGKYFWDAYGQVVELYKKSRCKGLFVTPPIRGAVEIRVTPRIVGTFVKHQEVA